MTRRKIQYWVIPPKANAEFAAGMEQVLDAYARPYDAAWPVLCMDEQPVQLVRETRRPIAATTRHPRRVDYEYERAGTASIFLFGEPLAGWRQSSARPRRTKADWAREMAALLEGRYRRSERITLVSDNLNTHHQGRFPRGVRTFPGARTGAPDRVLPHAQTRQLAERRRERVERHDAAVPPRSPYRRPGDVARRNRRLVRRRQQPSAGRRLADEDRRRALQAEDRVPEH